MIRHWLLVTICFLLVSCQTLLLPDEDSQLLWRQQIASQDFTTLAENIDTRYQAESRNGVLHYLELANINHRAGNYKKSAELLDSLNRLSPSLETKSRAFQPRVYEQVYERYYNTLNYLMLYQNKAKEPDLALENARIYARQSGLILDKQSVDKRSYEEQQENDRNPISRLSRVLEVLAGQYVDRDRLIYRDDAWVRYINGLAFEISGRFDDARINYEQAAKLYEVGYSEQFDLNPELNSFAWQDAIRLMKKSGFYEQKWPDLAKRKLNDQQQDELQAATNNQAELVVIEHADLIPRSGQLKIQVSVNKSRRSLILKPELFGNAEQIADQQLWFTILYADNDAFNVIRNFNRGGVLSSIYRALSVKELPVPPAIWRQAEDLGLVDALSDSACPAFISVPYFPTQITTPATSTLIVNGENRGRLHEVNSPAGIAMQQQFLSARGDLAKALGDYLLSSSAVNNQEVRSLLGDFAGLATCLNNLRGGLLSFDTRSWQTLPLSIRFKRISLPPGEHEISLNSGLNVPAKTVSMLFKPGEVKLLPVHSTPSTDPGYYNSSWLP